MHCQSGGVGVSHRRPTKTIRYAYFKLALRKEEQKNKTKKKKRRRRRYVQRRGVAVGITVFVPLAPLSRKDQAERRWKEGGSTGIVWVLYPSGYCSCSPATVAPAQGVPPLLPLPPPLLLPLLPLLTFVYDAWWLAGPPDWHLPAVS